MTYQNQRYEGMANPPRPSVVPPASVRPKRTPRRQVPLWVVTVAVVAASPLILAGAFVAGNYIVAHTTVTVESVSWAVPVHGHPEYYISCQGGNGIGACPYQVKPGSVHSTTVFIASQFSGMNVTLYAPSPFSIASTDPNLPALVPSSGLSIAVNLTLPGSPGDYSFTGNVTLG